MERPSRDLYFLAMARLVATRSTCLRLKVGAVLVDGENHVLSTGYCGAPKGLPHCTRSTCKDDDRCHLTVHAEANAIIFAPRPAGTGRTLYVTHFPCDECARLIVQAGIARVVFVHPYRAAITTPIVFTEAGVKMRKYREEEVDDAFDLE